jgi:hypothetical protein
MSFETSGRFGCFTGIKIVSVVLAVQLPFATIWNSAYRTVFLNRKLEEQMSKRVVHGTSG